MSGTTTVRMISAYNQMAAPTAFLAGFFRAPAENFYTSEEVEIDIVRSDEEIAIAVQDLSTGYRMNLADISTNKRFKPPILKEAFPINAFDLLKRMPDDNPFEAPDFRANLIARIFRAMVPVEGKMRRTIELQASQILQTGTVTLVDENGNALYTIDFKPKATHFPTAGTAWDQASPDIAGDILSLTNVIRNDGLSDPDQLIFGESALEVALADADFKDRFETRRIDRGTISSFDVRGGGGQFRGVVEIGNYQLDVWTYSGRYNHPQTSVKTQFVDPGKVIVRDSGGRMDATFGAIPNIGAMLGAQATSLLPELPGRLSNSGGGMDLFTNAWLTPDGEQLFAGLGARPLLIPTAIDTYGCLNTGI